MYESVTKYAHWSNYAICGMENFEISKMDFMSKQGTEKRRGQNIKNSHVTWCYSEHHILITKRIEKDTM